ncbi:MULTISPECIES: CARDB domain-containing protein [unclassified Anaeromyxobacter]|uniref:CARDB domain-containing protein n=1 Tax=unclassified Anaeromyxobacter TaxID=2620896 RepID=UPI001F5996EF|nr:MULTISPECIES: CARDB domain-containing protein [unclassified Anaeromyxobacter]
MRLRVALCLSLLAVVSCGRRAEPERSQEVTRPVEGTVQVNGYALNVQGKPPTIPAELMAEEERDLPALAGLTLDPTAEVVEVSAPAAAQAARGDRHAAAAAKRRKWIVQFDGPIHEADKARLAAAGARIGDYLPGFAFVVSMDDDTRASVAKLSFVRGVARFQPAYKLSRALKDEHGAVRSDLAKTLRLRVRVDAADGLPALLSEVLRQKGAVVRVARDVAQVEVPPGLIARLARLEEVLWIEEALPVQLLNDTSRWVIQSYVPGSTPVFGAGLDGAGQIVGVGDTGLDMDMCFFRDPSGAAVGPGHRKVVGYVAWADAWDGNFGHGTHVSGTVAGDQAPITGLTTAGGMAPGARLFMTDLTPGEENAIYVPEDLGELYSQPYEAGARIHTNSWGSGANWYETYAWSTDRFMWEHKDLLVLFANGNAGPTDLRVGAPATAKNVVSVGATENGDLAENVAYFSSNGPAWDGRLKPTLTAPGVAIVSADSDGLASSNNCGTVAYSGTSMATPTTAGAAALVRQYFVDGYWPSGLASPADAFPPSAALVKAVLVNSAQSMSGLYTRGPIPTIAQGWGRINLSNTLRFAGDSKFLDVDDVQPGLATGETFTKQFFATGGTPLKVTLVWTDYPGAQFADVELVNDLDLEVVGPDGAILAGNAFAGGASITGGSPDRLNVEEQVYLPVSLRGTYTVRVKGYNVPSGPQPFALVVTGAGAITSQGFIALDRTRYGAATTIEIKVGDRDLNVRPDVADEAFVNVRSDADLTGEVVTLVETGPNTSIFSGTLPTGYAPGVAGDGVLAVTEGGILTATYADENDGLGAPATVTATAFGDLTAPAISAVTVAALDQGSARIAWSTSEPSSAAVLYGKTPALGGTVSLRWLASSHDVPLGALEEGTTYFYAAQATDEAGNVSFDDGGGTPRTFTTPVLPPVLGVFSSMGEETEEAETVVFGTAVDPSGVASLTVNGAAVPVRAADGYFETAVPLALGENPITVVATDGRGQSATTTLVVHRIPLPDLTVTSVTAPDVAGLGMGFPVTAQVCNIGQGGITADYFSVIWFISEDDVLGPGDVALGSAKRVYSQLGGCTNLAYTIRASSESFLGRGYHVGVLAFVDQNEAPGDNNYKLASNLTTFEPADLTVTAMSAPARLGTSTPFSLTTTVANPGRGIAINVLVNVYLSTDDTITTADRMLGWQEAYSLDGGASATVTTSLSLPSDLPAGSYRLGGIVDVVGYVKESNEDNNVFVGPRVVVDGPDLEVTSVSGPATVLTGGTFTVEDTVTARPTGGGAGRFKVGLYLSDDPIVTTADLKLGERTIPSLSSGASSSGATVITLPVTWAGGTYYVGAIADVANEVLELDEANNAVAGGALTVIGPDLVATSVSAPASGVVGETLTVLDTIAASAAGGATPPFDVGFYLSTDPVITPSDLLLGWRSAAALAPGASSSASTPVTLPLGLAPGTYYVGVIADDFTYCYEDYLYNSYCYGGDVAKEPDGSNNARASGPIVVGGTDLVLTEVSAPATAGTGLPLVVHDAVAAVGGGTGAFKVGYYLSTDPMITTADRFLGYRALGGLAPGATSSADTSLTVPAGLAPGTYYVGAIADYEGRVAEASETNNPRAGNTVSVAGPDLTVSALAAPQSVGTATPFSVTATVANLGSGASPATMVSIYLSTDPVITTSDLRLGYGTFAMPAPGETSTATLTVSVPSSVAQATYYLGVFLDPYDQVKEASETNNASAGAALTLDRPDLAPTAVSGPPAALTGETITVSYTLSALPTGAGVTSPPLGIYLSSDLFITPQDISVGTAYPGDLASGASRSGTVTLTIPAGIAGGTYQLGAFADPYGTTPESDEANNGLAGGTIAITGPDLVATAVSGPASALRGTSIPVSNTVAASASGGAAPAFLVGVYLSSDATITASDLLLGYRSVAGLQPGASSFDTTLVAIPATVAPGTYYLGVLADDFTVCEFNWSTDEYECQGDQAKEPDGANNALAGGAIVISAP